MITRACRGVRPAGGRPATGPDAGRSGVVEQFHNAFRRITSDWDAMLDRRVMDRNLEAMIPLAAHAVRVEREGGSPDLGPLLALCHD